MPFIEKRSLMACTFSSVKFSGRAPQGQVLLRAFVGGALQPELVELSEAELVARVRADLRDLLGIERAPLFAEVKKWERSMPQYHVGHLERVKRIEVRLASLPGLVLAGNAYSGLGIPDCIRSGEGAADLIEAVGSIEAPNAGLLTAKSAKTAKGIREVGSTWLPSIGLILVILASWRFIFWSGSRPRLHSIPVADETLRVALSFQYACCRPC